MERIEKIKYLAEKSGQLLEKQIESYRQHRSNSGTIIGIIGVFIPFFLNGLADSYFEIKLLSLLPIAIFLWAIILFLRTLRAQPLDQSIAVKKFREIINKEPEDLLTFEIGVNIDSFEANTSITNRSVKTFNNAILLTAIGIIISVLLLVSNQFFKPNKITEPTKVELVCKI